MLQATCRPPHTPCAPLRWTKRSPYTVRYSARLRSHARLLVLPLCRENTTLRSRTRRENPIISPRLPHRPQTSKWTTASRLAIPVRTQLCIKVAVLRITLIRTRRTSQAVGILRGLVRLSRQPHILRSLSMHIILCRNCGCQIQETQLIKQALNTSSRQVRAGITIHIYLPHQRAVETILIEWRQIITRCFDSTASILF